MTGIYGYSRNPIYLAFNFSPIGLGIYYDNLWVIFSSIPSSIIIYLIAIRKEEKFGDEYLKYKKKVMRWI